MLLFIIKKVTAQITTKFVTIHQITSLSGPGITMFGGNQSTLPEINGRMRTFIINSYQSINKRSVTFREERTVPMYTLVSQKKPHNYWRLVASQRFKCTFDFTNELQSLWFIARRNFFRSLNYYFYFDYTSQVLRLMKERKQWRESFLKSGLLQTAVFVFFGFFF